MEITCNICKKTMQIDENLTDGELKVYKFLVNFRKKHNKSPSFREISKGIGLKSISVIDRYLYILKEKQYIAKKPYEKRSIVILKDYPCG
nr:hypothetical protein [uncultured Mediterranean phage uvMED]